MNEQRQRPGSVRHRDEINPTAWVVTQPGDPFYASALFLATEYLSSAGWKSVHPSDKDSESLREAACS